MEQSLDQNNVYQRRDAFEIKYEYGTGHPPGLVVVLDRSVPIDLSQLKGKHAVIRRPDGSSVRWVIDEAKDHLLATSLFFGGKSHNDVPAGSQISI